MAQSEQVTDDVHLEFGVRFHVVETKGTKLREDEAMVVFFPSGVRGEGEPCGVVLNTVQGQRDARIVKQSVACCISRRGGVEIAIALLRKHLGGVTQ